MNITLIGMAGVGKSSIGRVLAKQLSLDFVDIDRIIEKKLQMSLQQVIDTKGDEAFLKVEEQSILSLDFKKEAVVATGGSAVYSASAMDFLKKCSRIIYLHASFESINTWVTNRLARGLVGLHSKSLREIYDERKPLYERYADYIVELDARYATDAVVDHIARLLLGA